MKNDVISVFFEVIIFNVFNNLISNFNVFNN